MKRNDILIEADELLTKIDHPNLRIYDATILFFRKDDEPTAYDKYLEKHIPGSSFFDHDQFSDSNNDYRHMVLAEKELATEIGNIGIDTDSEIIFYTHGYLPCATRAWWVLRYAGHNNVRVLNGGLSAWEAAGGTLEQEAHQYPATTFECNLRSEMFVGKEDVLQAMEDGDVCTVNTLTPESYEQGHISGTPLSPCGNLMQGMDSFLSDDILASNLKQETEYERVITYCGGGIAATVNGIAHLIAGNKNIAVYDGSMSEWAGEGLPVTKGNDA